MNITEILNQAESAPLTREQIVALLNTDNHSPAFYQLLSKANEMSRKAYGEKGYVFLQIGLNNAPCSGNCKFCSLAASHYGLAEEVDKSEAEILAIAREAAHKIDALFLMTTADYPVERFLEIGRKVKALLPENVLLIANIGDFGMETARKLKEAGFTGVYHIVRLNEGVDTELSPQIRIATLDAIAAAGLDLIYCVEPIGPEHTYDQIAQEILRARQYHVDIMACMRRVAVPGTPLFEKGEISDLELAKIVAVSRIAVNPKISMNVHEPNAVAMLAGVNQLYAETGSNPRDKETDTRTSRGYSIECARQMLAQYGYTR